jgi:hypothetical protein
MEIYKTHGDGGIRRGKARGTFDTFATLFKRQRRQLLNAAIITSGTVRIQQGGKRQHF